MVERIREHDVYVTANGRFEHQAKCRTCNWVSEPQPNEETASYHASRHVDSTYGLPPAG